MNIYESISAVMRDCGFVSKNDKNPQQGYKYRGIDAVMNALNPALIKNKVFVVPEVLDQSREERQTSKGGLLIYSVVRVRYTFYAEDGSSVCAIVIGEAMDSGDKSMNKAMSAAFKYACFQTFCIPTEEMKDSEADDPHPIPKTEESLIADQQISQNKATALMMFINNNFNDKDAAVKWVLSRYNVTAFIELTEGQYSEAYNLLQKQAERAKKDGDSGQS